MAGNSSISWTDKTWNPIAGCSIVSPGCTNCYAMQMAHRINRMKPDPASHYFGTTKLVNGNAVWTGVVNPAPEHILLAPLKWKKPRMIFVNSMSDLFHESVPDALIDKVFAVMALCPQHTFQVLTKRSKRMREYVTDHAETFHVSSEQHYKRFEAAADLVAGYLDFNFEVFEKIDFPLQNVHLGVSCEDQTRADERIPDLLATPAAVRFVSAEPLLGPIDFTRCGNITSLQEAIPQIVSSAEQGLPSTGPLAVSNIQIDAINKSSSCVATFQTPAHTRWRLATGRRLFPYLDQIIVGGESGPGHRPMHMEWAESIMRQCADAGTAFFFKQGSGPRAGMQGRASAALWACKQFPEVT